MGSLTVAMYLTLDGVMESPSWTMPYWDDALSAFQDNAQKLADALLLGRVTYQQFAAAWPNSPDEGAPYMNAIRKYVPTTTLAEPSWNARFIQHDTAQEIARLKETMNLLVYGSAGLTRFLFREGLVDEYREMVFPLVLGSGKKLFDSKGKPCAFSRVQSALTGKGVLLNVYTK